MRFLFYLYIFFATFFAQSKEVALTFDDAPKSSSKHYETLKRTEELIRKLKVLNVPPVMIFTNPCKRNDADSVISQLKKYKDAGHFIGNHTCSHPRLDDVGFDEYSKDIIKADQLLSPLFDGQKFFRFPFLNESNDKALRDQVRGWLKENNYRNGFVTIDNDDYLFSFKINEAKDLGKKINYKKVQDLLIRHIIGAANFYENLAIKTLGYSPKHTILLHEMDATVMFIEPLIQALRNDGWKIIGFQEALQDKLYLEQPKSIYANNGLLPQIHMDQTGEKVGYFEYEKLEAELNAILGL